MTDLVVDTSAVLPWCFEDEADEAAMSLLDRVETGNVFVPALFPVEIANALLAAERRGRVTADDRVKFLNLLDRVPINLDSATAQKAYGSVGCRYCRRQEFQ